MLKTVSEAAKLVGRTARQIQRLCQEGKLPHTSYKAGVKTYYQVDVTSPEWIAYAQKCIGDPERYKKVAINTIIPEFDTEEYVFLLRSGRILGRYRNGKRRAVQASDRTVQSYLKNIKFLREKFGEITLEAFDLVEKHYQEKNIKNPTIGKYFHTRNNLFNTCISVARYHHYKKFNNTDYDTSPIITPFLNKRPIPPNEKREQKAFAPETIKMLIEKVAACKDYTRYDQIMNKALLTVAYYSGFRCMGICNMKLSGLDWEGEHHGVPSITTFEKYGKVVSSPFPEVAQKALREFLAIRKPVDSESVWIGERGTALSRDCLSKRMTRIGRKFGISGFHTHSLRYSIGTTVAMDGDTWAAQQLLHHEHLQTTQIYLKLSTPKMLAKLNTKLAAL